VLAAGFAMALFSAALAVAVHTGRFGPAADATGGQPARLGGVGLVDAEAHQHRRVPVAHGC